MPAPSLPSGRLDADRRLQPAITGWAAGPADARPAWSSVAAVLLLISAFLAVVVFVPADGRISAPLHAGLETLLGQASFLAPLGVAFVGALCLIRHVRPTIQLPRRRLGGVALLTLAVLPIEHLLGGSEQGTGVVGRWLSSSLLDLLGGAGAGLTLLVLLGVGVVLVFDLRRPSPSAATDAAR